MWKYLNDRFVEAFRVENYPEAYDWSQKALQYARDEFGAEDMHTATSLNNIAVVLRCMDRHDESEKLVREALSLVIRLRGMHHPETGNYLNNLAIIHSDRGEFRQAESLYRWAIEIREEALGKRHPDLIVNYHNMARMYEACGETERSETCRRHMHELEHGESPA